MRWRVERVGFWVALGVAVLALLFGISQYRQAKSLRLQAEAARQRAIFNLISHVENMEGNLAKARAASTTGQRTTFLTACWSHSQAAQESISQIGMTSLDLSRMQRFVAQVGDYSMVLSQKIARDDAVTPAEWSELERLETSVKDLARALSDTGMRAMVTGARFDIAGIGRLFLSQSPTDETLFRGFSEIDSLIQSVPSPAYDGPFSDRSLTTKPLARKGPIISDSQALTTGLAFLHPQETYASHRIENIDGAIPAFLVTGKRADGSEVSVAVAKEGGAVLWVMDQKGRGAPRIDIAAARRSAESFLASKGLTSFAETGWRKPGPNADRVVFTYAALTSVSNGARPLRVIIYPDMVKVEVGLDTGEVIGFDQVPYLTNGVPRNLKPPLVSESEARNILKRELKIAEAARLTIIPILPTREVMAWEFTAQHGSDSYLIYINAMTGKEEMVLRLVTDETGAMTM